MGKLEGRSLVYVVEVKFNIISAVDTPQTRLLDRTVDDEGVRRASNPDDDGSLQGLSNSRKHAQREIPAMWEEILANMSL